MSEQRATRAALDGASIDYPEHWEVLDAPGTAIAAAPPGEWTGFRPSAAVTIESRSVPIAEASALVLDEARAAVPGTHIVSYDLWPWQDVPARRIQFFAPLDDSSGEASSVVTTRWIWATRSRVVSLSAHCLPSQSAAMGPIFTWIASRATVTA